MIRRAIAASALPAALLASPAAAEEVMLGRFSAGDLSGWEAEVFEGETVYRFVDVGEGGKALEAVSEGTASGYVLERDIDLEETPVLAWRWRVEAPVCTADERAKEGDDFAVRIYFVTPGGTFSLFPDSMSYVWACRGPKGAVWPNPYTEKVAMMAVEAGDAHAGEWREYRRNIRKDFEEAFGRRIDKITHLAIMTDTDNSGLSARAWYGDISLLPE